MMSLLDAVCVCVFAVGSAPADFLKALQCKTVWQVCYPAAPVCVCCYIVMSGRWTERNEQGESEKEREKWCEPPGLFSFHSVTTSCASSHDHEDQIALIRRTYTD